MRIILLSHYLPTDKENYQELADLTIPNRDAYCQKHGYLQIVHSGTYHDEKLYYAIQRLHLLYDLMFNTDNSYFEYGDVFWVLNIQAVITNMKKPVSDFIDEEHDFFIHKDVNGLNAGSFLIRKSDWSKKWLEMIMEKAPRINHCWHEQQVMIEEHAKPEWKDKIKILDHPGINSYRYSLYNWPDTTPGDWKSGDLVLSLPGLNLQQRLDLVRSKEIQDSIIW